MPFLFVPRARQVPYASTIYIVLFSVYGLSFYSYFSLLKGFGYLFINRRYSTFRTFLFNRNKRYIRARKSWINYFLAENFRFTLGLQLYKAHHRKKYMGFLNYKRNRIYNKLPVRGQRTQTNAKTARFLPYEATKV